MSDLTLPTTRHRGLAHVVLLLGGTGREVGSRVLRQVPAELGQRNLLYVDLDESDLAAFEGHQRLGVGVGPDEALRCLEPAHLRGAETADVFRFLADRPGLRSVFLNGTRRGARRSPILTSASLACHAGLLERAVATLVRRFTDGPDGADVMLHLVASGAGGAGSGLLMALLEELRTGALRLSVSGGLRIWMLHAQHFTRDESADLTDDDRRRMLAVQALVDEHVRRASVEHRGGAAATTIVNVPPLRVHTDSGATKTFSREDALELLASSIATHLVTGVDSLASSSVANHLEDRTAEVPEPETSHV